MKPLRLSTFIAAPPEMCHRLSLTIAVQEQALRRVRAHAIDTVTDRPLQAGETVHWVARWLGVRWRMTTRIVSVGGDAGRLTFVDEQVRGPFGRWHHEHAFEIAPGGTTMTDDVEWAPPLGAAGAIVARLGFERFVRSLLVDHNAELAAIIGGPAGA
jgi:ligand-binding SRPBCC domain-containing protein